MAETVQLAFIGCGGIAQSHLDHGLGSFPDVRFAGWCDINVEQAEARREQVGGQGAVFDDAEKMLAEISPDAVYIMLPPFAHGPAEDLVLKYDLPFFVEKPVAIDLETAARIHEAVKRKGLITTVGFMNRYRDSVLRVRDLVRGSTPVMMHGGWLGGGPDTYEGIWKWWVQKDQSGGQFLEQTVHTIDLARFLFGDVKSVYAVPVTDRKDRPDFFTVEEASMVQLAFENGAAGNLYSSCCTPAGGGVSLEVWTTSMHAKFESWEHSVRIDTGEGAPAEIAGEENIFAKEDRAFIDAVKSGNDQGLLCTYEDGLKSVQIACAADKSMKTGKVVDNF
jgi:predicted dehydrogenase